MEGFLRYECVDELPKFKNLMKYEFPYELSESKTKTFIPEVPSKPFETLPVIRKIFACTCDTKKN